jgi:hypothetical protein
MPDVRETGFQRAEGGEVDIKEADARLAKAMNERMGMAQGGQVGFKKLEFMADGGKLVKGIAQVGKKLLESGEEAPKVDRLSMSYKDVTKRVPEVAEALEQLMRGEITKAQYNDVVKMYKPVTPYAFVPKPASKEEAIGALRGETAKSRYGMQAEYEPGTKVGLRLDIPAYTNKGVWVNSIHDQKAKKVAYGPVASVKNADLGISQAQSKKIALGGAKQPYARVVGDWNPMSEEEAIAKAQEYLNHPEWRQIGIDPERHSYFYDRATMEPITNAEEVIQIGPLVLGKNPKYGKMEDFEYAEGGSAFKKLQWFDGGGMAIDVSEPSAGSRREPLLTEKDWANIKRNAPEVYDWAKQNVKDEASQLKTARGVKDFALRTGAQYLGGIPDLVNLGLMGVDALADTNLSSEKPWFGSEQYIDAMHKAGALGENEFPIAETVAGILAPAGLIRKGVKKVRNMRPKEEPKKRLGGLTAMSR